jgi:hypothetical protein
VENQAVFVNKGVEIGKLGRPAQLLANQGGKFLTVSTEIQHINSFSMLNIFSP